MVASDCEKKLALIQLTISLDEQFSELISRYFSEKSKQDLLNKTIIQDMRISRKREIIKSILKQYPEDIKDIKEWCDSAITCIDIRNVVAHKLPDGENYSLTIRGETRKYSVDDLSRIFKECWSKINPPINAILKKFDDDDFNGDVVLVRVYLRNYRLWFHDIWSVEIENSDGEQKELNDYPETDYPIEEYEEQVKSDIRKWLTNKGIDMDDVEIYIEVSWVEEPE